MSEPSRSVRPLERSSLIGWFGLLVGLLIVVILIALTVGSYPVSLEGLGQLQAVFGRLVDGG